MKLFSVLFCLFICASVQSSQGFYRESIIDSASPLSVLNPAKRPEIERLAQNLRFFGHLGARPANNVYVHYQAIQNLLVFPTSPVTALSWMLFPISPLPTINPNNIGISDPLGKMTPEQLGRLIAVIANGNAQLQEIYPIFIDPKKVVGFVTNHNEANLKEFYRYALVDGVSKYVHRNMTPMDEDLHLTAEQQAACVAHPYLLVTAAFKSTSSHLLEIPGTEILREPNETWFTQAELETTLQLKYGGFSYRSIEKFRTMATVDMLWKSAQSAPNETLQLLTHYAWRKFSDKIDKIILASGAINEAQRPELMRILATPYTKSDYQEIVAGVQASEDIDSFMDGLTVGESNLLLYGGARYAQISFQDYGNVRVEHAGRALAFANCAEMSLFNLTLLAQLEEQGIGLERNPDKLLAGSPLRTFWETLNEEALSTKATRNRWTQTICRLNGVVYRKGGAQRSQWTEDSATAHWAELNPGILNQMRALFHLLGKPAEATALTYAGSTEETIEAAALRISQLLSGEPANGELIFEITPDEIKSLPGKKDWYGKFDVTRNDEKLADWHVESDHSCLKLTSKKTNVFPLDKPFTNPYVIGQLDRFPAESMLSEKITYEIFEILVSHGNLANEEFRRSLMYWHSYANSKNFYPASHQIFWGMMQIDDGRELYQAIGSVHGDPLTGLVINTHTLASSLKSPSDREDYGKACRNYATILVLDKKDKLLPENRCQNLQLLEPHSTVENEHFILASSSIEILSETAFPQLKHFRSSSFQNCNDLDIANISRGLPTKTERISIDCPISPERFLILVSNAKNSYATFELAIDAWYRHPCPGITLSPTQQEHAYNLLLPLAKAGRSFEPPFIELHTDEDLDLEPTYEALRIVAAIHKPMPLMIEDGVA